MKDALRVNDVAYLYSLGRTKASELFNEFLVETDRGDSRFPKACVIRIGSKLIWVNRKAFYYFMLNRDLLVDSTARKYVAPYTVDRVKDVL